MKTKWNLALCYGLRLRCTAAVLFAGMQLVACAAVPETTTGPIDWQIGKLRAHLDAPVVVSLSDVGEKRWGRHQFVAISPYPGGKILLRHHAAEDAVKAYGTSSPTYLSSDKGLSWRPFEADNLPGNGMSYPVFNGEYICLPMAKPLDVKAAGLSLPEPVGKLISYDKWTAYRLDQCAATIQDFITNYQLSRWTPKKGEWLPDTFRYDTSGALIWCTGDQARANLVSRTCFERSPLRVGNDLIFADYRSNFIQNDGNIPSTWGITCMVSQDNAKTWMRRSTIALDRATTDNLTEPVLAENVKGELVCVIRRADHQQKPMCVTYSHDKGKTWEDFVSLEKLGRFGVFPALVKMDCGVMVMSYGRPGIHLTFSLDGTGRDWTPPSTMLAGDDKAIMKHTDAYTCLLPIDKSTLLIAYTDFNYPDADGNRRKAILVRKLVLDVTGTS